MSSLSDLLRPIPGPNPSGEDTRYSGLYDRIKEARREEPDLPQGAWQHERKTADWRAVARLCDDALLHKTKDLQIAAWLTEALLYRDGFPGLTEGFQLLQGLIDQFWATVFPRSEEDELEFRAGPLEWVGSRLDVAVKSIPVTPKGAGVTRRPYMERINELGRCLVALGGLQVSCGARFGEMTPRFDRLRTSLEIARVTRQALMSDTQEYTPAAEPTDAVPAMRSLEGGPSPGPESSRYYDSPAPAMAAPTFPEPDVVCTAAPAPQITPEFPLDSVDSVHFTVTAPAAIEPASSIVVSLWVHLEAQRAAVIDRACQQYSVPHSSGIMLVSKGPVRIAQGSMLTVRLELAGARIDDPEDLVLWTGEIGNANFVVTLPDSPAKRTLPGDAVIYLNGVRVAKVQFVLQVGATLAEAAVPTTETRFRKAFASYASEDRDAVLGRLQGIRKAAPDLEIYFDVLTLRSGQRWEGEIERLIFCERRLLPLLVDERERLRVG